MDRSLGVFYHIACMGNWREVVREQAEVFRTLGVTPTACVLGTAEDVAEVRQIGWDVFHVGTDLKKYETPTLAMLWRWCNRNPNGTAVYLHTKGVSHPSRVQTAWRRLMNHWTIYPMRSHLETMARSDVNAIGADWRPRKGRFSGNFWIASARWINGLISPIKYRHLTEAERPATGWPWDRIHAELWLGSKPGIRVKSVGEPGSLGYSQVTVRHAMRLGLVDGDAKILMVLGVHRSGTSCVAGILDKLGVPMGVSVPFSNPANPKGLFEDVLLRNIRIACGDREFVGEDIPTIPYHARVSMFRVWEHDRRKDGRVIGGKLPALCGMVQEMDDAWHGRWKAIVTERPIDDSAMSRAKRQRHLPQEYIANQLATLANQRDSDLSRRRVPTLRINFAALMSHPEDIVAALIAFCGLHPTPKQRADAIGFVDNRLNHFTATEADS